MKEESDFVTDYSSKPGQNPTKRCKNDLGQNATSN